MCESRCGLVAEVDGDRVVGLRPDRDHPVSRGHACAKGLWFHRVHHSPDRVARPALRDGDRWTEVSWARALEVVGRRLRGIRERFGPDAIGLYSGNAAGHALGAVLGVAAFQRGVGTRRHYACLTLDNAPQFVVYEDVFGAALRTFAADFRRADAICLVGTDPLSSQCSQAQSNPRGVRHLKRACAEGRVWVVDPRPSATARAAGQHLRVRPGADVFLLGWLLREALDAYRSIPEAMAEDLSALRAGVDRFTLDLAVRATGVAEGGLIKMRDQLLSAERPLLWVGLGVLLGGHGTVGFWLAVCINAALGTLGRPGGWRPPPAAVDVARVARRLGLRARHPTVRGRSGHPAILDTLPAADLAADARSGDLRALVVVGGNPALSLPDHRAAVEALRALDLLVCVDLFRNDTGTLAHALLPAASWLARDDLPLHLMGQRWADGEPVRPEVAWAVVPPVGEARPDLRILADLCRAAGARPMGSMAADLALRSGLPAARLARWAGGLLPAARPVPLSLHPGGRVRLAIPAFLDALAEVAPPGDGLRLVTSVRPVETLNHWLHGARAARRREPVARAHPDTLARAGVRAGPIRVVGPAGAVEVAVVPDEGVAPGAVVLPFGWGHLPGAVDRGGVPANALVPASDLERFTGQPRSNGLPVRIEPA